MKKLTDLLKDLPGLVSFSGEDVPILGISFDSREVKKGDVFVAFKGLSLDGHKYIPDAIRAGATAIVGTQHLELGIPYVCVADSRAALAYLSAAFYDYPAKKMTVIGITGTDGKTTTSNLLFSILKAAGKKVGMISTVNAVIGDDILDTGFHVTTPDAPDLQMYLLKMVNSGLTHVILETTSHSLEQKRVEACEFDIAIVTNITHEHLDAHQGSLDRYRAAKARLFSTLAETGIKQHGNIRMGITNKDDWSYGFLQDFITGPQVCYGLTPDADIFARNICCDDMGIHFTACGDAFEVDVSSKLVGVYNVSNCLAAIAAAISGLGVHPQIAAQGIFTMEGIPGRMEFIDSGQDFSAIVDFAHTPNALLKSLQTARKISGNRVIAVFGSAGLRDREKRRMMSEISAEFADLTILTAEDPRTESLEDILDEMADGIESKGGVRNESYWCVPDRGDAIRFALKKAQKDDLVIICGKGHEQSMCFGSKEYPWDDRIAMKAALAEYLGVDGPDMPYLPSQD
jgi:UDP-N-acetylmuramoyl-L-alanyl-D-glutamate--2,6-diaminopimelate ligase